MKRYLLLSLALATSAHAAVLGRVEISAVPSSVGASAAPTMAPSAPSLNFSAPSSVLTAPSLAALPAAAESPVPAPAPVPSASEPNLIVPFAPAGNHELNAAERLYDLFNRLDARFPLPATSPTAQVRIRVRAQLLSAAKQYTEPQASLLETVAVESDRALKRIQERLDAGEIHPERAIRLSESDPEIAQDSHARVGVYPVAADPFQWGHLLIALRAVGDLGVDKIIFVLAGDDPRKPTMTPVMERHPMGLEVLNAFAPFFAYSPIAVGTTLDGETNIFRILALNPERRVDAWYMVGDDHYRLVDKKGNPDTLPKLEKNFSLAMGHSPTLHALKVAFIKREHPEEEVPTTLEVRFLDHVGFDASSTMVRGGQHSLMPFAAYDYARRAGLYGVTPPAPETPKKP
jgi:hypothetical protein